MNSEPIGRVIQAADVALEPDQQFADDLLAHLLDQLAANQSDDEKEDDVSIADAAPAGIQIPNSSVSPADVRMARTFRGRPSMTAYLATAALLLLTLVGGLYAAGVPRQFGMMHQSPPGVTNELIAQADSDISASDFSRLYTGVSRFTLEPGESMESGPGTYYGDGLYMFEVESGILTLEASTPVEVIPEVNDSGELMPDGFNGEIQTGERAILWPGGKTVWRNDGNELTVVLIGLIGETTDEDLDLIDQIDLAKSFLNIWPEPPARYTLRRLTFEPDASLPVTEIPGTLAIGVVAGEITLPLSVGPDKQKRDRAFDTREGYTPGGWFLAKDGDLKNTTDEAVVVYVLQGESIDRSATPET